MQKKSTCVRKKQTHIPDPTCFFPDPCSPGANVQFSLTLPDPAQTSSSYSSSLTIKPSSKSKANTTPLQVQPKTSKSPYAKPHSGSNRKLNTLKLQLPFIPRQQTQLLQTPRTDEKELSVELKSTTKSSQKSLSTTVQQSCVQCELECCSSRANFNRVNPD